MKNKTKITYIIPSLDLGGAERLLTELIKNINKENFDISVICLRRTGFWARELENIGVKVLLIGSIPKFEFLSILKIKKILKNEKPDFVHTHLFGADVYGGLAALLLGVKNIISTEHNLNLNENYLKRFIKRAVIKKFSKIIAVSDSVKKYAINAYGIEDEKILTIHNGIYIKDYYKKVILKNNKEVIIGSAGRLTTQKGFEKLILAMSHVEDKNIILKIAGSGDSKYNLKHLIKKLNLEDRVFLVGPKKDMFKFFSELDIYVQPSKWEGLGISILEAGSAGLPVIASRVDGIKEIITDNLDGLLYEFGDEKSLAEKISFLARNISERERLALQLQKRVSDNFSIFKMIESYQKVYASEYRKIRKILLVNKYHYLKGGAERAYFDTGDILKENGHELAYFSMKHPNNNPTKWDKYFIENVDYNDDTTLVKKIGAIFKIWYNFEANRKLKKLLKEFKPDVAHLHNIYHQISPSIINVLRRRKIPITYTLHDYKLISPNYSLMLNGNIWEGTKQKKYYQCFFDKCVKNSYLKSLVCVLEAYFHDFLGLYKKVNAYISPSNFLINKFKEFGFENEINYLPNPLPFSLKNDNSDNEYFLYYGRLSKEKGILDLLAAYEKSNLKNNLLIVGDGPEAEKIKEIIKIKKLENRVFLLGYKKDRELEDLISGALAVVVPSRWYENAPYTVVEAMSMGSIVIASRIGGLTEMINDGENGFLFNFADINDLAAKLILVSEMDEIEKKNTREKAREYVSKKNSKEFYYRGLLGIYNKAIVDFNLSQKNKKISWYLFIIGLVLIVPINTIAIFGFVKNNNFPKLANYFLNWEISDKEAVELAKWDLLVLDMEVQVNSRNQIKKIRQYNPDIIILAYITAGEIRQDACAYNMSMLRCELFKKIKEDWYLKDEKGNRAVAWPGTNMINLGGDKYNTKDSWNDVLPKFVYYKLMTAGIWDGVFYDTVWHDLYWVNNGELDINNDGKNDNIAYVNERYKNGVVRMFSTTRSLFGEEYIILENGSSHVAYQPYINGMMYESFPTPWEGAGYWPNVMKSYLEKSKLNAEPRIHIINANSKDKYDYQKMRWGLGNALLGDAYYSFDFGETHHGQTWWYDEYNLNLGSPISSAFRVDGPFGNYEEGLWRRNFENGVVFVNSYDKNISHDAGEYFIKIDSNNKKERINKIELKARDSIILFYVNDKQPEVVNKVGNKIKNDAETVIKALKEKISIENVQSELIFNNVSKMEFDKIVGKTNIADSNNDALYEIVLGAKRGDNSNIKILDNNTNRLLGVFPAYPQEFRIGVKTAIGDFDGDGRVEIATVPDWGGSHLKIYDFNGKLKKELFFNDKNIRAYYDLKSVYNNNLGRDVLYIYNY